MTLNATGPISLGGATAGQSINLELGQSATATTSLNASNVRTLAGVPSGAITMPTNFYGKSNQFAFTISTNQTNADLRTLAVAAGWNESSQLVATISSGVIISSNATGTPALTIAGAFPGGVILNNAGTIVGMGGNGGNGGTYFASPGGGSSGGPGGTALSVSVATTVNNTGVLAGGGGGGGGQNGYFGYIPCPCGDVGVKFGGNGGSGGRSSNAANSSGGSGGASFNYPGNPGSSGTYTAAGTTNAAGGNWGASGTSSDQSGGAGGPSSSGSSNITFTNTGTRYGPAS
jgi:hypothetical protein